MYTNFSGSLLYSNSQHFLVTICQKTKDQQFTTDEKNGIMHVRSFPKIPSSYSLTNIHTPEHFHILND